MAVPPKSTVSLSKILESLTKNFGSIDNRIFELRKIADDPKLAPLANILRDALDTLQRSNDYFTTAVRENAPRLMALSIDSADIGRLVVGDIDGPGQLTVLSGPPDYDEIGWIGTEPAGAATTITNITAGTATTVTDHELVVGDRIQIQGTTLDAHNGYWRVATTPTATTFTATGLSGSSTGGTVTLQFAGGWFEALRVGGVSPETAPFLTDQNGNVFIGKNGSITLYDSLSAEVGWLGTETSGVSVTLTSIVAGLATAAAVHNLAVGDVVLIAGTTNSAHNDYWRVATVPTTTTFTATGLSGSSTGGTVTIQFAGAWFKGLRVGGADHTQAPFFCDANGNVFIGQNSYINAIGKEKAIIGWLGTKNDASAKTITGATNATPIVITTSAAHGFSTGDRVTNAGVTGNTAANGNFVITVLTTTTYSLVGSVGNGAYGGGGTSTRYFNGAWFQELRVGGSDAASAQFIADANGNVRIVNGSLDVTAGSTRVQINSTDGFKATAGAFSVQIDSSGAFKVNSSPTVYTQLFGSQLQVVNGTTVVASIQDGGGPNGLFQARGSSGNLAFQAGATGTAGILDIYNNGSLRGRLQIASGGGELVLHDSGGSAWITISNNILKVSAGTIAVYSGATEVAALSDGGGPNGLFTARGSSGNLAMLAGASGTDGSLLLYANGSARGAFNISSGAAKLELKDSSGVAQIVLDGAGTIYYKNNVPIGTPRFSAYLSANQTGILTGTWTKVNWNTEEYDEGAAFDAATNYRWTPGRVGKAHISAHVAWDVTVDQIILGVAIYKNGAIYQRVFTSASGTNAGQGAVISRCVSVDAITDYFEIFAYQTTGVNQDIYSLSSYVTGHMIS